MMIDRKILNALSFLTPAVLLLAFFIPNQYGSRITTAVLLSVLALTAYVFVKKRSILSINKRQVLLLMSVSAVLYLIIFYISGFHFGFYPTSARFTPDKIFGYIVPIALIIAESEIYRAVTLAQNSRLATTLSYITCVAAEVLICANVSEITGFNKFMDVVGFVFFPAVTSNFFYHYIAKRYGATPNVVYRLIITLYPYVLPYAPAMPDSLRAFIVLILPLLIYAFLHVLFEPKKKFSAVKKRRVSIVITASILIFAGLFVMLISNQFRFGALVIATESMTGELNKGDAAVFEKCDGKDVSVGQVIVFEKNDSLVVHRVIDIKNINGSNQYFTQGDANDTPDIGFIQDNQIVGIVRFKIAYVGYPSIWLRELFK